MAKNGRISRSTLRRLKSSPGHRLRKSPSKSADAMNFKHRRRHGRFFIINDSYRTLSTQWRFWRRWGASRAAVPGYSNHGWGRALDISVGGFYSTTYKWLSNNAGRYGWWQPPQFRKHGRKPEPWHWEYRRKRDRSRAVQPLQKLLRKRYGYRGAIDRVWGDSTDGPARQMFRQLKQQPRRKPRIKRLQRIMRKAGTYAGRIDGDLGAKSRRAWREFRRDFYCGGK